MRFFAGLIAVAVIAAAPAASAQPLSSSPAYNWTGFYWGLNAGAAFGEGSTSWNYFAQSTGGGAAGCPPGGVQLCVSGASTVHMSGPIGGVQAGYNWVTGNVLAGIEADFQATGQSGTREVMPNFTSASTMGSVNQGVQDVTTSERMPWLGTVRGRLGTIVGSGLFFATGGLAYGRVEADSSALLTGISPCTPSVFCPAWGFTNSSAIRLGWTAGAGAEWILGGNWRAKVEYLFVDLGSFTTTYTGLAGCFGVVIPGVGAACSNYAPGPGSTSIRTTDSIVRFGLNYKLN